MNLQRLLTPTLVVFAASMVGHVGNFALYIVTYRVLGDAGWSTVASLTALGLIVTLPASGVQAHLAAVLASATSRSQRDEAWGTAVKVVRRMTLVAVVLLFAAAVGTVWAVELWRLTLAQWAIAAVWVVATGLLQVTLGPLQGLRRFGAVAFQLAFPFGALRPIVAIAALALLDRSATSVFIALLACTATGLVASTAGMHRGYADSAQPADQVATQHVSLAAAVAGLLGVSVLINGDVALAKVLLDDAEASTFAAAALIGKIAFHGPAALAFVLLPTVTGLAATGQPYRTTYIRTLGGAVSSGLVATVVFAVMPGALWSAIMGDDFKTAVPLVPWVALVSTAIVTLYLQLQVDLAVAPRRVWWRWVPLGLLTVVSIVAVGDSARSMVVAVAIVVAPAVVGFVSWELFNTASRSRGVA